MDRSPAGSPRSSPRSLVLPVASLYSRLLFTKGLCLCYFIAFASALAQWEGLHGLNGIYPVAPFGPAADDQAYTVLVLGLLVASAGLASASAPIVPLLAALPLLYVMLLDLAGATPSPFFHFQWDVLLVEAGLVGAFWGDLFEDERIEPSRAVRWALRFLAFKLMWYAHLWLELGADLLNVQDERRGEDYPRRQDMARAHGVRLPLCLAASADAPGRVRQCRSLGVQGAFVVPGRRLTPET